ncbi:hypothetical protein FACS1894205_6040 [Alphaproteobacteria bacterium]|nr:hypothetical protein FACS1894205_6040 [Alphaproteobacteria bacterium]
MTLYAKVAPGDHPRLALHPDTRRPFPDGIFVLTDADLANSAIRRLFPKAGEAGGLAGGRYGDLILTTAPAAKKGKPSNA